MLPHYDRGVAAEHRLLVRVTALPVVPTNVVGALLVYAYFNYINPLIGPQRPEIQQFLLQKVLSFSM